MPSTNRILAAAHSSAKNKGKFAYGHHYINDLPIVMAASIENIDIFVYVKGKRLLKHPDDKHAFTFKNLKELLKKLKETHYIFGKRI